MSNKPQFNKELQRVAAIALMEADGFQFLGNDILTSESPRAINYVRKAIATLTAISQAGFTIEIKQHDARKSRNHHHSD